MNHFQGKANFIWQVADDILHGTFKQHEYGDVILPFVVLRWLDCVLNGKKDEVIRAYNAFKDKLPDPSARFVFRPLVGGDFTREDIASLPQYFSLMLDRQERIVYVSI